MSCVHNYLCVCGNNDSVKTGYVVWRKRCHVCSQEESCGRYDGEESGGASGYLLKEFIREWNRTVLIAEAQIRTNKLKRISLLSDCLWKWHISEQVPLQASEAWWMPCALQTVAESQEAPLTHREDALYWGHGGNLASCSRLSWNIWVLVLVSWARVHRPPNSQWALNYILFSHPIEICFFGANAPFTLRLTAALPYSRWLILLPQCFYFPTDGLTPPYKRTKVVRTWEIPQMKPQDSMFWICETYFMTFKGKSKPYGKLTQWAINITM